MESSQRRDWTHVPCTGWQILIYYATRKSPESSFLFFKTILSSQWYIGKLLKDFWCGPFLKPLLNLLQYCFCFMFSLSLLLSLFFFFLVCKACGILAPWSGISHTPCIGRWSLKHWTAREISECRHSWLIIFSFQYSECPTAFSSPWSLRRNQSLLILRILCTG